MIEGDKKLLVWKSRGGCQDFEYAAMDWFLTYALDIAHDVDAEWSESERAAAWEAVRALSDGEALKVAGQALVEALSARTLA